MAPMRKFFVVLLLQLGALLVSFKAHLQYADQLSVLLAQGLQSWWSSIRSLMVRVPHLHPSFSSSNRTAY